MKRILLILLIFSLLFAVGCNNTGLTDTGETTETSDTTVSVQTSVDEETTTETSTETTEITTLQSTETTYVEALGEYKVKLSTMSEEDCWKFLKEAGVEIPEQFKSKDIDIKRIIKKYEDDPLYTAAFGWTVASDFMAAIDDAVARYYGLKTFDEIWSEFWATAEETTS